MLKYPLTVLQGHVFRDMGVGETLPMQGYCVIFQEECIYFSGTEELHGRWQRQTLRNRGFSIVVAFQEIHGNVCRAQLCHGGRKEKSCAHILPSAIKNIARNDDKVNILRNGERDQRLQRPSCGTAYFFHG
jgi:hypothetical protein